MLFGVGLRRWVALPFYAYYAEVNSAFRPYGGFAQLWWYDALPEPVILRKGRKAGVALEEPRYTLWAVRKETIGYNGPTCFRNLYVTVDPNYPFYRYVSLMWVEAFGLPRVTVLIPPVDKTLMNGSGALC
jgi:hypothetical protein